MTVLDDVEWVAWDLATVSGALSEIATTWRRAKPCHPSLPVGLPQHLADLAGRLAADVRSLAVTRPQQSDLELSLRLSALREGAAYAHAITSGPGALCVGDAPLWESVRSALQRTGSLLALA
ncbi:MAG TPA: hypothetical protein VH589_01250 [Trebonia sp.]